MAKESSIIRFLNDWQGAQKIVSKKVSDFMNTALQWQFWPALNPLITEYSVLI